MTQRSNGGEAARRSEPFSLPAYSRPTKNTPGADTSHRGFGRLVSGDAEQRVELGLPLPEKRPWQDDEDARGAFRQQLRHDESGFDRLSEADLVGQDAAALGNAPQGEHDRVDLVGIGVDAAEPL